MTMTELFFNYDHAITAAQTLQQVHEIEEAFNADNAAGKISDGQREALEGAVVYMEIQLKAGKKPEEIKHRNGGTKDAV